MSDEVLRWLPWGCIFLFSFLLIFLVHKRFVENNVWGKVVKKYKDNVDLKVLSEAQFVTKFGGIENHSILYKLDRLMLLSWIKNVLPFVNGEAFLCAEIALSVAGFFEGTILFQNVFVALFLAVAQTMPVMVKNCSDDEATVIMVDANIQREDISISEKAKAYRMKYDAMKHQGMAGGITLEEMSESAGESRKTIQRLICLSNLSDEYLELIDSKKLGIAQGIDLSYIPEEQREIVLGVMKDMGMMINMEQSARIKNALQI